MHNFSLCVANALIGILCPQIIITGYGIHTEEGVLKIKTQLGLNSIRFFIVFHIEQEYI
jgi:hypothetical protein